MIEVLTLDNLMRNRHIWATLLEVDDDAAVLPEEMPILARALIVEVIFRVWCLVDSTKVSHMMADTMMTEVADMNIVIISSLSVSFPASPSFDLYYMKDPLNNKVPTSGAICLKV